MTFQSINLGAAPNDGTGDDLRTAGGKINSNFETLFNRIDLATAETAAFSKDLITFSSVDYFEALENPYIRVTSVALEPVDDPLDEKAIIRA